MASWQRGAVYLFACKGCEGMATVNIYANLLRRRLRICGLLVLLTGLALVLDLCTGAAGLTLAELLTAFLGGPSGSTVHTLIVWMLRLPMSLTCLFVGAALGIAGLEVQNLTHNALASPYTLGITASASFGAAVSIVFGISLAGYLWVGTVTLALLFALFASAGIFLLGQRRGMGASTLVFAGIITNFFFSALQQFLQYKASPETAQVIASWNFGNLSRATWISVVVTGLVTLLVTAILARRAWPLTILTLGEERARSLGVETNRLRLQVFGLCALLIAVAVGFIGTIAFVGLVAPHCARILLGDDQRFLLPMAGLAGSLLVLVSSVICKLLSQGAMVPVGILTSLVGVPFLAVLLLRNRRFS